MASDNLNQVGKSIRKIKETADYASKKAFLNKRVERSRDVFDTIVPFEMEFKTDHPSDRVSLDLKFNKPPPRKGCNAECFSNNCQTFVYTDGGDHLINLGVPYIQGSTRVFRNRTLLSSSSFEESDPANGLIYVQGASGTNEITVCYVTGDCTFDASNVHYSQGVFTYVSDGSGNNGMVILNSSDATIYSSNTEQLHFTQGSTWRWSIGLIVSVGNPCGDQDTGHQVGLMDVNGFWQLPHESDIPLGNINLLGWAGVITFTADLDAWVESGLGGGCHIHKTTNCNWFFDPIDFNNPIPDSGQTVVNDTPFPSTNLNSPGEYKTYVPYVAGTLIVFVNSTSVPIIETDPNQGLFTFVTNPTPTVGMTITCQYVAQ